MYLMGRFIVDSYPDEMENDLDFFRFPIIDPDQPIGEDAPTDGFFMLVQCSATRRWRRSSWRTSAPRKCSRRPLLSWAACPPAQMSISPQIAPPTQKGIALIQGADYHRPIL